ncbi:MAG: AtpZ/AtpI family protein [Alphaproteobacteria bacterium]|nr:MAG: AtpZ/AtpI family protein [Alphaproteobacteria bacterium]
MSDQPPPPPLDDLDARLREAQAKRAGEKSAARARERGAGLSFALRIGVEVVAALGVGVGIGLLLDRWLGSAPWFLIVFFVLGAAAGMLNVYRVMAGFGYTAGYRRPGEKAHHKAPHDRDR